MLLTSMPCRPAIVSNCAIVQSFEFWVIAASNLIAVFIFKMILQVTSNRGVTNSIAQPADVIQILIYIWFNDERSPRKVGSKANVASLKQISCAYLASIRYEFGVNFPQISTRTISISLVRKLLVNELQS